MIQRVVLPPDHQLRGEVKQRNNVVPPPAAVDAKSRRVVLQDIGNLVTERAAIIPQGKKAITEKQQPKPDTVIVISSDDESEKKPVVINRRKPVKKKTTFTSVLNARSKAVAACKPKDNPVLNIDGADIDNDLAVVEYVDDIYKFYKLIEDEGRVHDYMDSQPDINVKMRSILMDWLTEVHRKFELMPETFYLTINIVDRFLSKAVVTRSELQLVGISSMLIACKYEEIWSPEVNDFVCISDKAYVREQVLAMEKTILGELEWHLTVPTPYVFLVRYIKAAAAAAADEKEKDEVMENMVFFLAELGLMQYPTIIFYGPSRIAASAVYAARFMLNKTPFWTETLKHYTGYSEDELKDCAKMLLKFHSVAAESKLKAVYKKFSSPDYGAVALVTTTTTPARSLLP